MTQEMSQRQIANVCRQLSYIPTLNVKGLRNREAYFLFDNWTPNSCCAHSYVSNPKDLTRGFLRDCFRYVFSNVDWLIGVTPGDNERALRFNRKLGFKVHSTLPDGFARGVDTVMQAMYYTDCRFWRRPA